MLVEEKKENKEEGKLFRRLKLKEKEVEDICPFCCGYGEIAKGVECPHCEGGIK